VFITTHIIIILTFVDMILGVDFLIKSTRNDEDYWIPVQVKTSMIA
jgi:hypothetical protein